MKLLMVSSYFDTHPGGIEVIASRLAQELAKAGHRVEWAAASATEAPASPTVTSCPLASTNLIENRSGLPIPILTPGGIARLDGRVRASDVVLIHDTLYATSICAMISARRHRKPVLVLQHLGDARFQSPVVQSLMRLGERLVTRPMLSAADQVVFISQSVADHFGATRLKRRAEVSFSGVDTSVFYAVRNEANRQRLRAKQGFSERPVALYVGRFVATKGLETLRAAAEMRPDVDFVLAGWGAVDPQAWDLPNVRVVRGLAGATLADLYRSADVFVLASPSESYSLVVREALACGLPVVCGQGVVATDPTLAPYVTAIELGGEDRASSARRIAELIGGLPVSPSAEERADFIKVRYDWARVGALYAGLIEGLAQGTRAEPPLGAVAA